MTTDRQEIFLRLFKGEVHPSQPVAKHVPMAMVKTEGPRLIGAAFPELYQLLEVCTTLRGRDGG